MNHKMIRFTAYFFLFLFLLTGTGSGQREKPEKESPKQPIVIDDFNKNPTAHPAQFPNLQFTALGYGIYFEKAVVNLSRVAVSKGDSALCIKYELPPLQGWGNWLSIRCEFDTVLDLSGYTGLELNLKVRTPSAARLRVTLVDIVDKSSGSDDELWWFDFKSEVLKGPKDQWQTLMLPFKNFYESYGAGSRHNDGKLDLSKIVAYEINIVSEGKSHPKGRFGVNSLTTY